MGNFNHGMVSIIIPVYRTEKCYLDKCINSIDAQDYENYEVMMIDDGNSAEYAHMLDEYQKVNDKIRVIHKENGGASAARNTGIIESKGEYVVFVDSDDAIPEQFLSKAVNYMESYNLDIAMGGYRVETVEHIPDCTEIKIYSDTRLKYLKEFFLAGFSTGHTEELKACLGFVAPWAKMFRKSVMEGVLFDEKLILSEDNLFDLYCLNNADKVGIIPECWYYYSVVENSICHKYRKNALCEINNSTEKFREYLNELFVNDAVMQEAFKYRMLRQLHSLLIYYYCNEAYDGKRAIRNIRKFLKENEDVYSRFGHNEYFSVSRGYLILRTLAKYKSALGIYLFYWLRGKK